MTETCVNDWCKRPAHHADGRCKPCWLREVWRPKQGERYQEWERERARVYSRARRRKARERLQRSPFFEPPTDAA